MLVLLPLSFVCVCVCVCVCACVISRATSGAGGAIALLGAQTSILRQAAISSSSFVGNEAYGGNGGGAINSYQSDLSINSCTFTSNKYLNTVGDGGAILAEGDGGTISVTGSTATSNEVGAGSGGFLALVGVMKATISSCTINTNTAINARGGGVAMLSVATTAGATVNLVSNTFNGNMAQYGGGFAEFQSVGATTLITATLDDCVFIGNNASTGGGGAIFHLFAAPTLSCNGRGIASSVPAVQCTGTTSNIAGQCTGPLHPIYSAIGRSAAR